MSAHWVRVLQYLSKFNPEQHEYVAPFCLTQDGIAESVGISRAHVSLVLKDLVSRELVESRLVYIVGGKRRRKVWVVTGRVLNDNSLNCYSIQAKFN